MSSLQPMDSIYSYDSGEPERGRYRAGNHYLTLVFWTYSNSAGHEMLGNISHSKGDLGDIHGARHKDEKAPVCAQCPCYRPCVSQT